MSRPLQDTTGRERLPVWLKKSLSVGQEAAKTDSLIKDMALHTICESGRCPNRDECYSQKTATFMVMGDICTRSCRFCSVTSGRPEILDVQEPVRVAQAAKQLGLRHVVVTSVNRDDLPDEGARHFADVIRELRTMSKDLIIEVLTPDFKRTQRAAIRTILNEGPDIFNHNIETVPSLYTRVRPQADFQTSLEVFRIIKEMDPRVLTKSGLMLGLGEKPEEVLPVLAELQKAGCEILTLGQYLQSSKMGVPVSRYVSPEEFYELKVEALKLGFSWVESGPFVRSSFHAKDTFEGLQKAIAEKRMTQALDAKA